MVLKRIYDQLLKEHLSHLRQMAFIMGPRQVGKTTISQMAMETSTDHLY